MERALLSPKVDFVFKKIFGSEKHPRILISFLNSVMKPIDPIEFVKINNTDIEKEHVEDKYSRLDIKAITNKGEHINIEIQIKNEFNMIKRSLYYWSKMYESQIIKGDNYDKLAKTVCINILDFKYLKNNGFHNAYRLKEINSNEELTDNIELHFIEIPKLRNNIDVSDMLTVWIEFLNNPEGEIISKLELSKEEIREAKDELIRLSGNSKERELYEKRKESILDKVSALAKAEKDGIDKGLQQGIEQGREEGIKALIESFKELGISEDIIIQKLIDKYDLTEDKAKEYINK